MEPIIQFGCRSCDAEITIGPEARTQIVCPHCQNPQTVRVPASLTASLEVTGCVACGHEDLYLQKDFNRTVGIVIVGIGILFSTYFFNHRQPFNAMASLVVTALIDLVIYSLVSTVTVCYSCHAVYRGFKNSGELETFDLKKLEKYGGRSPRW